MIPIFASTHVRLDGDGGIAVDCDSSYHLFRPVSVQAMWTMFQCLHKVHLFHSLVRLITNQLGYPEMQKCRKMEGVVAMVSVIDGELGEN